jgi:hypothetical protein
MLRIGPVVGLIGVALAFAACGGSTATSTSGAPGTPAGSPAIASGTPVGSPAVASATPAGSPAVASATSESAGITACDLVTAAEAGHALGSSPAVVTVEPVPGDADRSFCIYRAQGTQILTVAYSPRNGGTTLNGWKTQPGVKTVSGLGDGAVFDPTQGTLFVLKGDALVAIEAGDASMKEAARLAAAKSLGATALVRM